MPVASGSRLTAARLNPAAFQLQLGALYTLTGTNTDLTLTNVTPGYSGTSYTVPDGGMTGLAVWTADFQLTAGGTITAATVDLVVDGAIPTNSPEAIWDPGNVTDGRATCSASWPLALAAGSHSFGLRASVVLTSGTIRLNPRHTNLSILLHP